MPRTWELVSAVRKAAGVGAGGSWLGRIGCGRRGRLSNPSTTRELEVLQLIVHGKSNKEIASALLQRTLSRCIALKIKCKSLDIHNTAELVVSSPSVRPGQIA